MRTNSLDGLLFKRIHRHVECEEDFYCELYELFEIARKQYRLDVIENHMKPECFIELFENTYHYIDCNLSQCKNARLMILCIIKELFVDTKVQSVIMSKDYFSRQDVVDLYIKHVTLDSSNTRKDAKFPTFGCNLSKEQIEVLVEIVQTQDIFLFPEGCNVRNVLSSFFNCCPKMFIYVKNVRNTAILLDAMAQCRLINNNWQHVVEEGKLLKKGLKNEPDKCITATCLSSSLSRTRQRDAMTASQYAIRNVVTKMLKAE